MPAHRGDESGVADRSFSVEVVKAVAAKRGVIETDLPPLAEVINPDALDNLFGSRSTRMTRKGGKVTFMYCGYSVTVTASGEVTVEE